MAKTRLKTALFSRRASRWGAAAENCRKVGAIRLLAVLPSFVGLCVGRRVLRRAEEVMRRDECVRCMRSDLRASVLRWFERRGRRSQHGALPEGLTDGFRAGRARRRRENLPAASNGVDREGTLFNDSSVEGGTSCGSGDGGSMEVAAKQKQVLGG